jgi:hypothetical protein
VSDGFRGVAVRGLFMAVSAGGLAGEAGDRDAGGGKLS